MRILQRLALAAAWVMFSLMVVALWASAQLWHQLSPGQLSLLAIPSGLALAGLVTQHSTDARKMGAGIRVALTVAGSYYSWVCIDSIRALPALQRPEPEPRNTLIGWSILMTIPVVLLLGGLLLRWIVRGSSTATDA